MAEAAKQRGVSTRRVHTLCVESRVAWHQRLGKMRAIPVGAEKPNDARVKSGKYIKNFDKTVLLIDAYASR